MLLTLSCFFPDAARRCRGAENLLAFLLSMLYERSRYRVKVIPVVPVSLSLFSPTQASLLLCAWVQHPAWLSQQASSSGTALCHRPRVVGNPLSTSACDISAASPTESHCYALCIVHPPVCILPFSPNVYSTNRLPTNPDEESWSTAHLWLYPLLRRYYMLCVWFTFTRL